MYKKIFLAFLLALFSWTLPAQSINGKWNFKDIENGTEYGVPEEIDLTISEDIVMVLDGARFNLYIKVLCDMVLSEEDMTFKMTLNAENKGKVLREGNMLTLIPDKNSMKISTDAETKGIPGGGMIKSFIESFFKKELSKEFKNNLRYNIVSIEQDTLVLENILSEKEIKKGIVPVKRAYIRVN